MRPLQAAFLPFLLCLAVRLLAGQESPVQLFAEANALYQKGEFASAELCYRQLVEAGIDSGQLYYNLGNACFKQKHLGVAIYRWEQAKRRLPYDPDVRENLEFANLLVVDRIDVPAEPWPVRTAQSVIHALTIGQISWASLIFFLLANGLYTLYLLTQRSRVAVQALIGLSVAGLLFVTSTALLSWRLYERSHQREGVVVEQKVDLRSGPGSGSITVFTIHEGSKVRVRNAAGNWYQVSLPNGWNGWLQAGAIRVID